MYSLPAPLIFFIIAFFAAPLFTPYAIYPWSIQDYLAPAWGALLASVYFFTRQEFRLPYILLAALVFVLLFYLFQSAPNAFSFYGGTILALFATFVVGTQLDNRSVELVLKIFSSICAIYLIVAWTVWLGFTDGVALNINKIIAFSTLPSTKPNGPFLTGNIFGILAVCGWISAYWLYNKGRQNIWFILSIILWAGAVSSLSRGAWLAQGFVIIGLLAIDRKHFFRLAISGVIAVTIGHFVIEGGTDTISIVERFENTAANGFGERLVLWLAALEMWSANFLTGVGAGQFGAHYLDYQFLALQKLENSSGLGAALSAHNVLLQLVAEHGLVGLVFGLTLTFMLLFLLWKLFRKTHLSHWPALIIVALLWFQGMFNITMTTAYPILYFSFFLGIAAKPLLRKLPAISPSGALVALLSGFVAITLFAGAIHQTNNWNNIAQWAQTSDLVEKKELAEQLLQEPNMIHHMVETAIYSHMRDEKIMGQLPLLRPYIINALKEQQRPNYYRALFLIDVMEKRLDRACEIGRFIQGQRFTNEDERNKQSYDQACQGKAPTRFYPPK